MNTMSRFCTRAILMGLHTALIFVEQTEMLADRAQPSHGRGVITDVWPSMAAAASPATFSNRSASATPPWTTSAIRLGSGMSRRCRALADGGADYNALLVQLYQPELLATGPAAKVLSGKGFPIVRRHGEGGQVLPAGLVQLGQLLHQSSAVSRGSADRRVVVEIAHHHQLRHTRLEGGVQGPRMD